jgi:hypothetical protein
VIFLCSADAFIVVATEKIATAVDPIITLPIMVLFPSMRKRTPAFEFELSSFDAVARVRR